MSKVSGVRTAIQDADPRELGPVIGVFLAFTIATSLGYMAILALAQITPELVSELSSNTGSLSHLPGEVLAEIRNTPEDEVLEFFKDLGKFLLWMTLPAIPAGYVYTRLPANSVDRFHSLGKTFALFIPINLVLSAEFIAYQLLMKNYNMEGAIGFVILFSVASVGLPGPYLGAILASRRIRDE